MEGYGLSPRGAANVEAIWPRISKAATEREKAAEKSEDSCIDLSTSENWLLRGELINLYKKAIQAGFAERHLSYQDGFAGDTSLLIALVQFLNTYFKPRIPVVKEHLATAPGAAFCLDAILFNIAEAGDGLLVLTPCWSGFDWLISVKSGVQPIFVRLDSFGDVLTSRVVGALEAAFDSSPRPVKGLLFTNPHNPFGQCYPKSAIEDIVRFCDRKKIHFISDEIYAMSGFANPEVADAVPFVSALQLDIEAMGCDLSRVHTIWSVSKDLGSSGLRMGCCVTQGNRPLATGLALASNTQMSCLTAIAVANLLTSPDLPRLFALNSERLCASYLRLTAVLRRHNIRYIRPNMTPFLFAKVAPDAETWDDEAEVIQRCKQAGVSLSAGRSYHVPELEKGWARINFAIQPDILEEALRRLGSGLITGMKNGVDTA